MREKLILPSPSAAARLDAAIEWVTEALGEGEVLVLTADPESGSHLARAIAARRGTLIGLRRSTLDGLAYQLALPALVEKGRTPHSRLSQQALVARIVHQARAAGRLGRLAAVAHWPGFARALTATLDEIRLHAIAPEDIERKLSPRAELSHLLERYESEARSAGVADRSEVLETAAATARSATPAPLGVPTLLLDLALRTPREVRLVEALAEKAPRCLATVPSADARTRRSLESALGAAGHELSAPSDLPRSLRHLQTFLFSGTAPEPDSSRDAVVTLTAPGEAQESVELARAIQWEAERGIPFDRMAILLRSPGVYTPLLEDALSRAGIPAHFENGTLRPDPAGRAFLALLDCAAEQLAASRFAEYLSLGQIPGLAEDGEPERVQELGDLWIPPRHELAPSDPTSDREPRQLDLFSEPEKMPEPERAPALSGTLRAPWRWERLLVDAAVIGGRERWERRLAGLARELTLRLGAIEDPEGAEAASLRRQKEDLDHLTRFALPIIGMLDELPERARWGEWLDHLEKLAATVLTAPDGVLRLLGELRPMSSVGPVELFEVREVLSERLTLLAQEPPRYRYGRVWVAPIEAVRGLAFDVVLVPGLAERTFPRKIVEDALLLDEQRIGLAAGLPLQADRIAEERLALFLAAGAARRKIVFSYPSIDLQKGRSKVPSFYLLEIARAAFGELPALETLEREAAASSGARLGWPAPREASRAIDVTEHDLAFLSDALRPDRSEDETRGTARYLMSVSDALARSLRARYQKGARTLTPPDGLMDPSPGAKKALSEQKLGARAYSVTSLEKFGACPYRFFLNAILRLRPRETAEQITHLDPLTYGRIVHVAQYEISRRLEEEGLLPVRPANLAAALDVLERVFLRVEAEFVEELAPAIDRIWRDELRRIRADLRGWLRKEANAPGEWVPYRRELTFGMRPRGPADPASVLDEAVLAGGVRLRGAIDLVERRADGKVRITDHKSGRAWVPDGAVLNGGETLQPIFYALAYEALTGEEVVAARLYYCTERGGYQERIILPDEEALRVVAEFERRLDEAIEQGFFPAAPRPPLGCKYCDYAIVCGPRAEIYAERKKKDPRLSPLHWIRALT